MSDEDFYKREEDRKWREKVDHETVTALTAIQMLSDRAKRLERQFHELDRIIRGDPQNQLGGLAEAIHEMSREVAKFNAVLFVDSTGRKGLVKEVESLKSGETRADRWLSAATKILVALITTGAIWGFWPQIRAFLSHDTEQPVIRPHAHSRKKVVAEDE